MRLQDCSNSDFFRLDCVTQCGLSTFVSSTLAGRLHSAPVSPSPGANGKACLPDSGRRTRIREYMTLDREQ